MLTGLEPERALTAVDDHCVFGLATVDVVSITVAGVDPIIAATAEKQLRAGCRDQPERFRSSAVRFSADTSNPSRPFALARYRASSAR